MIRYPAYYKEFRCKGGACTDNCCIGWEIDIDTSTYQKYMSLDTSFGSRLRQNITHDEPPYFTLNGERCPFLNDRNLCDIIHSLGEEGLCEICDRHPRFIEWLGDITEIGVGLCCEVACELVLRKQSFTFLEEDSDGEDDEAIDLEFRELLFSAREKLYQIMSEEGLSIPHRFASVYHFSKEYQHAIDRDFFSEMRGCIETFQLPEEATLLNSQREITLLSIVNAYHDLEYMDDAFAQRIKGLSEKLPQLLQAEERFRQRIELEYYLQLLGYFIFRYWMKSLADGAVLQKTTFALMSVSIIYLLDLQAFCAEGSHTLQHTLAHAKSYSKEIEYSEDNLEMLAIEGLDSLIAARE